MEGHSPKRSPPPEGPTSSRFQPDASTYSDSTTTPIQSGTTSKAAASHHRPSRAVSPPSPPNTGNGTGYRCCSPRQTSAATRPTAPPGFDIRSPNASAPDKPASPSRATAGSRSSTPATGTHSSHDATATSTQ